MAKLPLILLALAVTANAELTISSKDERANLIELYTSEGCSSCPPADRWFSGLRSHPDLWRTLVPLAFHVDYWDYIGWKDRFAQPQFADRQRRYGHENNMRTIYTPGVMSNGAEWRNFSWNDPDTGSAESAGKLSGVVGADQVAISFEPADAVADELTINVALLGFGLTSEVIAGENRGRKLTHDFVVLEYTTAPLKNDNGTYRSVIKRPTSNIDAQKFALTIWVSGRENQQPLQAAGGWL